MGSTSRPRAWGNTFPLLGFALGSLMLCLAGCSGSAAPAASTAAKTESSADNSLTLRQSIPVDAFQPDGRYQVVAANIRPSDIDGVEGLQATLWVYPPAGVALEPNLENPSRFVDGDERVMGPCTYRLDINEAEQTVTMTPVKEPSQGTCGRP